MSNVRAHNLANDIKIWMINQNVSNNYMYAVGVLLQTIHFILFLLFFYFIFTVKTKSSLWILLMIILFVLASQIYFGGCLISRIEKTLINAEKTIFEYILKIFGRTNFVVDSMKLATSAVLIILLFLLKN